MYDPKLNGLIIPEVRWDIEKHRFIDKDFKVGDKILIIPCIYIDHYEESEYGTEGLKNLYQNTYEFNFSPIKKFCHPFSKHCYHYLIELPSGISMFHFNWNRKYNEYIRVGKKYVGFGSIKTCGYPSTKNPFVPSRIIEGIVQQGVINKILAGYVYDEYGNDRQDCMFWSVDLLPRGSGRDQGYCFWGRAKLTSRYPFLFIPKP